MSEQRYEPEQRHEREDLLESLLSPEETDEVEPAASPPEENEDVDLLVDELEAFFAEAKHVPFGKKLLVDEARAMELVDRLRTALPAEVRQAQRILDEQDHIIEHAREQARRIMNERGVSAQIESERERILANVDQEAERIRHDADVYVRGVLSDLSERLTKIQASVSNGIQALNPPQEEEGA